MLGRVAFLGSGAFGVPLLERLPELADELLVLSRPDAPAGRGLRERAAPVAAAARSHGMHLLTPTRLRSSEARYAIAAFRPDGLLLAAYGELVPADLLAVAPRPPLNVHPSLLPRHRGAAPVASTILAGDPEAGVSLMIMVERLDAGPLVGQWRIPLSGREETPELEGRLGVLAAEVVPPRLAGWATGQLDAHEQEESQATYQPPFTRRDGWIDWGGSAEAIDRQVRALQAWPGAWTTLGGRRLHVRRAHAVAGLPGLPIGSLLPGNPPMVACGLGALTLETVQPEGRPPMAADAWRIGLSGDHVLLGGDAPPE
ncbi:MAG TPA: methionyl-tRNA formyltransferase [Pleomorphomonadaceae bacterium]|nr:methionyl-tRNA formyltransferase [Pleomorphomonadaceae bacterium]